MTNGFTVDTTALGDVVSRLRRLSADLAAAKENVNLDEHQTGHHLVSSALSDFVSRWTEGRARIRENVEACVGALEAAVHDYEALEAAGVSTFIAGSDDLR